MLEPVSYRMCFTRTLEQQIAAAHGVGTVRECPGVAPDGVEAQNDCPLPHGGEGKGTMPLQEASRVGERPISSVVVGVPFIADVVDSTDVPR